jgi:hypothetical protein
MPIRVPLAFALLVTLASFTSSPAYAFHPAPRESYTKDTPCGTYRFVMLGREDKSAKPLSKQYPASGLYRIGGPPVPLWTVNWYAYEDRVVPLCDGVHLVVQPGGGFDGMGLGIHFFANGQLLREYPADDLVGLPGLLLVLRLGAGPPHTSLNHGTVDEKNMTFHLSPGEGTSYVFDITTGEIVSQFQPWRFAAGVLIGLLMWGAILWFFWKRKPEPARPQLLNPSAPSDSIKPAH